MESLVSKNTQCIPVLSAVFGAAWQIYDLFPSDHVVQKAGSMVFSALIIRNMSESLRVVLALMQ